MLFQIIITRTPSTWNFCILSNVFLSSNYDHIIFIIIMIEVFNCCKLVWDFHAFLTSTSFSFLTLKLSITNL
jgi:hypothetical protein